MGRQQSMTEPLLASIPHVEAPDALESAEQEALGQLKALFPDHTSVALQQALREHGGNVERAVDRILMDEQLRGDFEIAQALQREGANRVQ